MVTFLLSLCPKKAENVTINLFASNGNPDIFLKTCAVADDCKITRQEIKRYLDLNEYPANFIDSSHEVGNDKIIFTHNNSTCTTRDLNSNNKLCLYLITVYVNSNYNTNNEDIRFMLTVSLED